MQIQIEEINGTKAAVLTNKDLVINEVQDAVDLLGNAYYNEAQKIIIQEHHLHPDFFNLKTGFAGEILQKFSNYNMKLEIIGEFKKYNSKSLKDFIYECNCTDKINFIEK